MIKTIIRFLALAFIVSPFVSFASTTSGAIDTTSKYAWSNNAGWINFNTPNGNIVITDSGITGYAWSANYGWINMSPSTGGVTISASGALSGYAWGSGLGWINFSGVSINSSGKFVGQATGTVVGTLTFDCTNCNVTTDYRPANYRTTVVTQSTTSGGGAVPLSYLTSATSTASGQQSDPQYLPDEQVFNIDSRGNIMVSNPRELSSSTSTRGMLKIRIALEKESGTRIEDIAPRVVIEGTQGFKATILLVLGIADEKDNLVWKTKKEVKIASTVELQNIINELNLAPGKYVFKLHASSGPQDVYDLEKPFEIVGTENPTDNRTLWGVIVVSILLLIFVLRKIRVAKKN